MVFLRALSQTVTGMSEFLVINYAGDFIREIHSVGGSHIFIKNVYFVNFVSAR